MMAPSAEFTLSAAPSASLGASWLGASLPAADSSLPDLRDRWADWEAHSRRCRPCASSKRNAEHCPLGAALLDAATAGLGEPGR
jgi:hypothetical protein